MEANEKYVQKKRFFLPQIPSNLTEKDDSLKNAATIWSNIHGNYFLCEL